MIFETGHFSDNTISKAMVNEMLTESRTFSERTKATTKPTVFLSHKHYEEEDEEYEDLRGVIKLLQDEGAKVFIDSMDAKMPDVTSGETARIIKDVIKNADKFIFFASNKAIESFWCNWELGIGDTHKFMKHIAILPIKGFATPDAKYKGNEYLQIYPRIDYEAGNNRYRTSKKLIAEGYYFSEPINEEGVRIITPLQEWLNKK